MEVKPSEKYFNDKDLKEDYDIFELIVERKWDNLTNNYREWLFAWNIWDLRNSPMKDKERSLIRYGHYVGWFDKDE